MLEPKKYEPNYYFVDFLSLFISKNIVANKPITTNANIPIIIVPFVHETKGMFKNFIFSNLLVKLK